MTAQPPSLNDSTILRILSATLDTLPVDPNPEVARAQREAATAALAALRPRDAVEAMFAAQAVAAHYAAMECFGRAAQPEVSDQVGMRLLGTAVALSRLAADQVRALERRQATTRGAAQDAQPEVAATRPTSRRNLPSQGRRPPQYLM
jgi:hypothetical protein